MISNSSLRHRSQCEPNTILHSTIRYRKPLLSHSLTLGMIYSAAPREMGAKKWNEKGALFNAAFFG